MNEWIKVENRFPDLYNNVLVFANNKGTGEPKPYSIAMWIGDKWEFINHSPGFPNYGAWQDMGYTMHSEHVTHWMPLPDLPKVDDKISENCAIGYQSKQVCLSNQSDLPKELKEDD